MRRANLGTVIVGLAALASCSSPVEEEDSVEGAGEALSGAFTLRAVHSDKCVDVEGRSMEDGANVHQWRCHGQANQQWRLRDLGGGVHELRSAQSGMCLAVADSRSSNGANVEQSTCDGDRNQRWRLVSRGSGQHQLKAVHSGKCLDVAERSAENGASLQQWSCGSGANQKFRLERVDAPVDGGARGTPVGINGRLRVCGTKLCNQHGNPIQLRGMSTHGIQWYGWNRCITESSLDALANDWQADILRVSLYVQEGGYETDPDGFKRQVDRIVDELSDRGLYVLLDWHMLDPGDPHVNKSRAREYFSYMTQKHGDKPNVLYEIANEPSGVSWGRIKSYAEEIIPLIRQHDPDGIVIVGTREWSSFGLSGDGGPEEVINSPVRFDNIMYSFHFYAASHQQHHRDGLARAADRLPVFVTEWGSQEYTGDGPNDFASTQAYIDLMARKKISWTSWNYSDDERSGAAFEPGTCPSGPWSGSRLKPAGAWVRDKIRNPADSFPTN